MKYVLIGLLLSLTACGSDKGGVSYVPPQLETVVEDCLSVDNPEDYEECQVIEEEEPQVEEEEQYRNCRNKRERWIKWLLDRINKRGRN